MTTLSRRTLLWTVPAVTVAAAAPAYATSAPSTCVPSGFKYPGQSHAPKSWAYVVTFTGCHLDVCRVVIDGKAAVRHPAGAWTSSFTDSRSQRPVQAINKAGRVVWSGVVSFPPIQQGGKS